MNANNEKKFDPIHLIGQFFDYAKHFRLMLIAFTIGPCAAMIYFMFATPLYQSVSMVSYINFGEPLGIAAVRKSGPSLNSNRVLLAAAQRMGLLGADATYNSLPSVYRKMTILNLGGGRQSIEIFAANPEVVRSYPKMIVDTFLSLQERDWEAWRDEALTKYAQQITQLDERIEDFSKSMSAISREKQLTALTLEQRRVLQIPRRMVEARERIALMEVIATRIDDLRSNTNGSLEDDQMQTAIDLLSLLDRFQDDTRVSIGDIVPVQDERLRGITGGKTPNSREIIVGPSLQSSPEWMTLDRERRVLEEEIRKNSDTYLPNHRVMKDLNQKLEEAKRRIKAELIVVLDRFDLELAKLRDDLKNLESRMPEYYEVTEQLGESAEEVTDLAGKKAVWDSAKERISKNLAAITFTEKRTWYDVRLEDMPKLRDKVPVSPNKRKLAIMGLMLGVACAGGLPIALNLLDAKARDVLQLELLTGIRGIGIVPLVSQSLIESVNRSPAQGANTPSHLLECFRIIRSSICLHPSNRDKSQVILVTSSRPREGKSTVAANLAWAFNSMGEKTLLMDCDLRRGRSHTIVGIANEPGMTRLLLGKCTPSEAIIQGTPNQFYTIPRGPVIPGAPEIFSQVSFEKLMELLRKNFDRIIIDSPPILGLSEASALQHSVDGTLLVVRSETTSRKDVLDSLTFLNKANAHLFGFVLNAVDLSKASNYYKYYYYSAAYYDQFEEEQPEPEPQIEIQPAMQIRTDTTEPKTSLRQQHRIVDTSGFTVVESLVVLGVLILLTIIILASYLYHQSPDLDATALLIDSLPFQA